MKKLVMLLLAVLLCLGAAYAEDIPFTLVVKNDGAILIDCTFPDDVVECLALPAESRSGVSVIEIADNALVHNYIIRRVEIPASIAIIPEDTFGYGTEIILHPGNPYFTNENGFLIDTRTDTLLHASPSAADQPLPEVSRLGDHCLDNWYPGEHVVLPDTLTSIGRGVCAEWMDTIRIDIPDSVTEIGAGAFNCAGLTSIDLPDGLTCIPDLMLSCTYITEITIPEGVTSIGGWAFYLCPLTRVEIPASCTFVAWDAFDPEVELVCLGENTHIETWEEAGIE